MAFGELYLGDAYVQLLIDHSREVFKWTTARSWQPRDSQKPLN